MALDLSFLGGPLAAYMNAEQARYEQELNKEMMVFQREISSAMTGAEVQQFQLNAAEAQKAREWNRDMDNTKYQRAVQDMQAAGVNPALAMNGGVTTQATSNAQAQASSSQASLGRAGQLSSVAQLASVALEAKRLKQDYELRQRELDIQQQDVEGKNAERQSTIALQLTEKEFNEIRNQYADEYHRLQNEGQEASNELTRQKRLESEQEIRESQQRVKESIARENNEIKKGNLIIAQTILTQAQTTEIIELLPFKKNLMIAQTSAARAQAAVAQTQYMINKGLIDGGYIENQLAKYAAEADMAVSQAEIKQFINDIKLGKIFNEDGDNWLETAGARAGNYLLGGLFKCLTAVNAEIPDLINIAAK